MHLKVYYTERFKEHDVGNSHPESPKRLDPIINAIKQYDSKEHKLSIITPKEASEEDLLRTHDPNLITLIRKLSEGGGGRINFDTIVTEKTYEIAKLAVGAAIETASTVWKEREIIGYAVVRPPGHHADITTAGGFCFFNNIAIATEFLIQEFNIKKVAIIDLDNHYGNGTAQIFYHRNDVLYVSIHSHPQYSYPGSGYPSEVGVEKGRGYNINIPLLPGTDSIDWLYSVKYAMTFIEQFEPEIIMVSIGFDGLKGDPVGYLNLEPIAFQGAAYMLQELAKKLCDGKLAFVLEGGYKINQLGICTTKLLNGIFGLKPKIVDNAIEENITGYTIAILKQVKKSQKDYWNV